MTCYLPKIFDNITSPPKRFFAFGCSFTKYFWATWANIIGAHLESSYGTTWYNFGKTGIGNEAIANLVSQANLIYNFTKDDLVIVCWTNIARKDNFDNDKKGIKPLIPKYEWWGYGNIFTSPLYPKKNLKKIAFSDLLIKNLTYIELVRSLLKDKCEMHFLQMCQIDTQFLQNPAQPNEVASTDNIYEEIKKIYSPTIESLYPSFYKVVWNDNIVDRRKYFDPHPLPSEHFKYLKKTFSCEWHPTLDKLVKTANDGVIQKGNTLTQRLDWEGYNFVKVTSEFTKDNLDFMVSEGNSSNRILI